MVAGSHPQPAPASPPDFLPPTLTYSLLLLPRWVSDQKPKRQQTTCWWEGQTMEARGNTDFTTRKTGTARSSLHSVNIRFKWDKTQNLGTSMQELSDGSHPNLLLYLGWFAQLVVARPFPPPAAPLQLYNPTLPHRQVHSTSRRNWGCLSKISFKFIAILIHKHIFPSIYNI